MVPRNYSTSVCISVNSSWLSLLVWEFHFLFFQRAARVNLYHKTVFVKAVTIWTNNHNYSYEKMKTLGN